VEPFDPTRPNVARVWDYWLGGKDNFAADRELAEKMLAVHPPTAQMARENRQFLGRAVSYVAARGIRQFVDVGAGLPTAVNTHDIARRADPDARIAPEAVGLLAVRLPMMAGFMGKKQDEPSVVEVSTTDPAVTFTLDTGGVALTPGSTGAKASVALPAEAFVRLVYGRLDDEADVTSADGVSVAELQAVFPGF